MSSTFFSADRTEVDVVVVGSGFGGAVMAARMAEAGMKVLVLERGPWWGDRAGAYERRSARALPRGMAGALGYVRALTRTDGRGDRILWSQPAGLFDVHLWPGVTAVVGSGVGGGSLVYAGYQSRPAAGFFDRYYPAEISDSEMAPYFGKVEAMQRPRSLPHPVRSRAVFDDALTRARVGGSGEAPVLAVEFGDPDNPEVRLNAVGSPQTTCRACGACTLGCEYGSKTTLDLTYLFSAERNGADIRALCEVTGIGGDGPGYQVLWRDHTTRTDHVIRTPRLVLSAGTIGTLRLLFAARDKYRTMRRLPPALGMNFSGNGDYLAMLTRASSAAHHGRHTMFQTVHRTADEGFIGEAAPPVAQLPLPKPLRRLLSESVFLFSTGREAGTRLESADGSPYAQPYKHLDAEFYARTADRLERMAEAYRPSRFRPNWPFGSTGRRLVTVHPVGGASIGRTLDDGVVDHRGEVFGHPGLFIVDGSTYPVAPGVPPSLTIAAMAERQAAMITATC